MHIVLDRGASVTLSDQLFVALKRLILDGSLAAGSLLPPSRRLADDVGVSRTVTVAVYERLLAEGFVETRQGAGTFVAKGAILAANNVRQRTLSTQSSHVGTADERERPDSVLDSVVGFGPLRHDIVDFRTGVPELRLFPVAVWQRLQRTVWSRLTPWDLGYGEPEGRRELRSAVCNYLHVHRGVDCSPGQLIMTSGTTQAIALITAALKGTGGSTAVLEDPVTCDISRIIEAGGMNVVAVRMDDSGLRVKDIPRISRNSFVYVTPSHHYPLGIAVPIDRRISLVEYARHNDCYLVEDDYDSEFRYRMPPVSTLFELDPSRVLYIGTFSKTLSPALRTAFIVAPPPLVSQLRRAKWHADLHGASPDQLVLARFISEGHYARHVVRMQKVYERRWKGLETGLIDRFGKSIQILGSPAGMHVAVRFPGVRFSPQLLKTMEENGAKFYPVSLHTTEPERWSDCLVIGFGHLDEEQIRRGLDVLAHTVGSPPGISLPTC